MKRTLSVAVAALALASLSQAANAADPKAKATPAKAAPAKAAAPAAAPKAAPPTAEQIADIKRAGMILRLFNTALGAKEVADPVKSRLMACLYNNKLATISVAAGKAVKENGLSDEKAEDVYRAAAGVCGVNFKKKEDQPQAPASSAPAPQGR